MNEIDFYVGLIDEEEVNNILKLCNKRVMSDNLELKKTKIKTIFRGIEQVKKGKKTMNNPFWVCISRHKLDLPLDLTEKELINYLNEQKDQIPDYKKFANLKLRFSDKMQGYLEMIEKNIEANRYIFDFGLNFQTASEVLEYFNKVAYLNNKEELISLMDKFYTIAVKNGLIEDDIKGIDNIENWTLLDLYSEVSNTNAPEKFIIEYLYIKSHSDINKDILTVFTVDVLIGILLKFSTHKFVKDESEINKYLREIDIIKENIIKVEQEKKETDKKYKKVLKDAQKDISNKEVELENLRNKINTLEEELKEVAVQKEKINTLINNNSELKQSLSNKKIECEELKRSIKEMELYCEYAFGLNETNNKKIFGIIYSSDMDVKITKKIFNEVVFIASDKWKEKINGIKTVYIQQQGITTRKLNEIKKYCADCGITNRVIPVDNEKTLIEQISILKHEHNLGGI
ncbi:hypothetical protein ACPWSR_16930 [Alloiococcus sp. CFN-8]|uniref:hypothetical protein n=1 Tax=Alloiococcus sp. CFN-8 TaxID=3416081 RepID=UPI003CF040A8